MQFLMISKSFRITWIHIWIQLSKKTAIRLSSTTPAALMASVSTAHPWSTGPRLQSVSILPAALLVNGKCRVENVPDISDVRVILAILEDLGVVVKKLPGGVVTFDTNGGTPATITEQRIAKDGKVINEFDYPVSLEN